MANTATKKRAGTLYVVATPIGHRDDITLRALNVLAQVDLVAAEDTRHTGRLLAHHNISARLSAYHDHNEATQTPRLINRLKNGDDIALVSDAGTPGISDPGYRLIFEALQTNLSVVPIPGASAITTALSVSGLPTDSFVFVGFLPAKKTKRLKQMKSLINEMRTLIFYESPQRIVGLIDRLEAVLGDRPAVLAREMSKMHEEFIRDRLSQLARRLRQRESIKGECTLLVAGNTAKLEVTPSTIQAALTLEQAHNDNPISVIVKKVADQLGAPRNQVYREALRMKTDDE